MPSRFPKEVVLRDGRRVLIRLFTAHDTQALFEFFGRLPADVRRFAWDNIDDPGLVQSWGRQIDYARTLNVPLRRDEDARRDGTIGGGRYIYRGSLVRLWRLHAVRSEGSKPKYGAITT